MTKNNNKLNFENIGIEWIRVHSLKEITIFVNQLELLLNKRSPDILQLQRLIYSLPLYLNLGLRF